MSREERLVGEFFTESGEYREDERVTGLDPDFVAIEAVVDALSGLDTRSRIRVVAYVLDRLGLGVISVSPNPLVEE